MSLLNFLRGNRIEEKPARASIDDELLLGIEERLRQRVETLVAKAVAVRSRLTELLGSIESADKTLARPVIGADGDDIDFLLADILTLRLLLHDMKQQMHLAGRVRNVEAGRPDSVATAAYLRLIEED